MKPLYWGLGLLTALLALCLFSAGRISAETLRTEQTILDAQAAARAGDGALAREKALEARRRWEASAPFVDAVTSHEEIDEISRDLAGLAACAETGQREEFLALCARLTVQTAHLRRMERPCWFNILAAGLSAPPNF